MNNFFSSVASFQYGALLRAALAWFWAQPWWAEILVIGAALYGGYILVVAIARAVLLVIDQLIRWALQFIHWFSSMVSQGIIAGLQALGRGVMFLLRLLFWPFLWVWEQIVDAVGKGVGGIRDKIDDRKELRRLWKEEWRDQFKTFKEFKEAFEQGHGPEPKGREEPHFGNSEFEKKRNAPDPFVEACEVLDLPKTGEFTEKELERRYRKLINGVHPDREGSGKLAAMVNDARNLIKQRKGWA